MALRESQLALYRHPESVTDLASSRGPNFARVVTRLDAAQPSAAADSAPTKTWAAFVLSGLGR